MTSIYLSPRLAGSRARSCGPGWGREGREGKHRGQVNQSQKGPRPPPPPVPHTQGRPSADPPHPQSPHMGQARRSPLPAPARPPVRPPARWGRGPRAPRRPQWPRRPPPCPPRATAGRGRRRGSVSRYLHEGLYRAFGRVQVGGAQMAALVHRGRRVYQEQ